jgi:importin-5
MNQVRLAAMEAFAAFFRGLSKKNQPKYFTLVGDILNILPPLKESNDSEELSRGLMSLIEMAEYSPRMFKEQFNSLVKFSVAVIQEKELTDATRQNALELMSTFAEHAPNMCRKDPEYVNDMVTQCLSLMTDVGVDDDDASEWAAVDDVS